MIVKIITTDATVLKWKSIKKKINNIHKVLKTMKNVGDMDVEVCVNPLLVPTVVNGRITHTFMETLTKEYTKDGEVFVMLHMSNEQRTKFGIEPTLRGIAFHDDNFYSEGYFWADEHTKRGRYNQFEETCLHELRHLIFHRTGKPDNTHEYHDKFKTIKGGFKEIDFRDYQVGLLTKISSWFKNYVGPTSLQPLVKRQADKLVARMKELGYEVVIFEGYRSSADQDTYYAKGRTIPGKIITNAKGGESFHNYGVAVDIVFLKDPWGEKNNWKKLGEVGKAFGFEWGGDWVGFPDRPHFQMTLGYSIRDFQNKKVDYNKFQ